MYMARIDFAARFTSSDLDVAIMLLQRGPESVLRIQLKNQSSYGSDLHRWAFGGWDSATQSYVSAEWQGSVDPWNACDYWGPLKSLNVAGEKFCGSCGAPRVLGGRFCGNCGTGFADTSVDMSDIREQVLRAIAHPEDAPSLIANLISSHSLAEFKPEERSVLTEKIRESFSKINSLNFIDGMIPSNLDELTLADAQRVAQQVADGNPLNENDLKVVIAVLTKAPLFFGWWGPFKAFLKFLDPAVIPEEFGEAIARLDSHFPRPATTVKGCENTILLTRMFTLPSESTANYMRRRVRRDLMSLAVSQPDVYAKVAFGMLRAWDANLRSTSYAPAYVLLGGSEYLESGSRWVRLPATQELRREAHPEIWNQHADLALELIPHIKNSVETYTFARQVLRDAGVDAPLLTEITVPLALMSTDQMVLRSGCSALSTIPGCWPKLSTSAWSSFFSDAEEIDLQATVTGLLRNERIDNVTYAANQLLETGLEGFSASRGEAVARVYLAYSVSGADGYRQWPHSLQADVTAVTVVASAHDFSLTREMWISVLAAISVEAIIAALNQLTGRDGVPNGSQLLLADLAVKKDSDWQLEERIKTCLEYGTEVMYGIAWRTADLLDNQSGVLVRVSDWLRQSDISAADRSLILNEILRRVSVDDASGMLTSVLTDSSWGFDNTQIAQMLSSSSEAALLLWAALGQEDPDLVIRLIEANSEILTLVGDSLTVSNTKTMSQAQITVLTSYLLAHPERVFGDPLFGVHLACSLHTSVQRIAIDQLIASGHMPQHWLVLAESLLPLPTDAAREFVTSIKDRGSRTDAALVCIDSPVQQLRDFGLQMLDSDPDQLDLPTIWSSLVYSDDPIVQARVIEESLVHNWDNDNQLSALDERLLVARRGNRRTKENIKTRLKDTDPMAISPRRIAALQDMASGRNTRDREWALQRLAHLSLAGVDLANIEVSVTSGGQN